jgi:hypothetical protein
MNNTDPTWNEVMKTSYWNGNGQYQHWADMLHELVPHASECSSPKLERYRKARYAYYDLFINGRAGAGRFLGVSGTKVLKKDASEFVDLEAAMDRIILAAVKEAGWM